MKIIITESQYRRLMENIPEIDQILDKMGEVGYENLDSHEKITLNKYSEHLKSGQKTDFEAEKPNVEEFDDMSGKKWSKTLKDGSKFTFQFEYEENDMELKMLFGIVNWNDTDWVGCFTVDGDDQTLGMIDFVEDTGDFETYDSRDPFAKPKREYRQLHGELGKLVPEVEYFVEEEIIPEFY